MLVTACDRTVEDEARDIQEAHEELLDEATQVPQAAGTEDQLEAAADVAEARKQLASELADMEKALEDLRSEANTAEERQAVALLQQRFGVLASRLNAAGTEPEVYEELADEADALERDIETYRRERNVM